MYTDKTKTTKVTKGSPARSVRIKNGSGQVYFTAEADGYIFIKFAEKATVAANYGLGAATYMPKKTATVYSKEE